MTVVEIVAVALGVGLGTLAFRLVFAELRGRVAFPAPMLAALDWVPAAALAALVAVAFVPEGPGGPLAPRLAAALATGAVAWWTRNLLLSVGLGLAAFWTAGALLA